MELHQVLRRYRAISLLLKRARDAPPVRTAESEFIARLARVDALEAELATTRFRRKLASGRLTRMLKLFYGLRGRRRGLAVSPDQLGALQDELKAFGSRTLDEVIDFLRVEFDRLERRGHALHRELQAALPAVTDAWEALLRATHAAALLSAITPGAPPGSPPPASGV
ncbi:MAG: hypothetical protein U0228_18770 [Myxococcaceae bacterium]